MSPPSSASQQGQYANSGSIVVQVGQCGNQIGPQLFKLAQHSVSNGLVDRTGYCRAVCVDTEDKVANVRMLNKHLKKVKYREGNVVNGHFGRGSNWAMGYNLEERYGYRGEDSFMDQCVERVRIEAERCDSFMATCFLHSLAGGTGSGVGTRLTQLIRDMFPNRFILSVVVAPLSIGENPMQCYNSLLCCSHLSSYSDQIVLLENDAFASKFDNRPSTANNSSSGGKGAPKNTGGSSVGFEQINEQFAQHLAGVIFPTDSSMESVGDICAKQYKQVKVGMEIPELIRSVCPMPSLRFSRIDSVIRSASSSGSSQSVDSMLTSLSNVHKSSLTRYQESDVAVSAAIPSCISCVSVLRGPIGKPMKYDAMKERLQFLRPVTWNPFWLDLWSSTESLPTVTGPAKIPSVTLCSNGSSASKFLARVWSTSRVKFDHNAYLHWYEKFECTKSDFEDAFDTIESVVADYNEAVA